MGPQGGCGHVAGPQSPAANWPQATPKPALASVFLISIGKNMLTDVEGCHTPKACAAVHRGITGGGERKTWKVAMCPKRVF